MSELMPVAIICAGVAVSVGIVLRTRMKIRQEEAKKGCSQACSEDMQLPPPPEVSSEPEPVKKWMCQKGHLVDAPLKVKFYADRIEDGKLVKGSADGPAEVLVCPICHSGELDETRKAGEEGVALQREQEENSTRRRMDDRFKGVRDKLRRKHNESQSNPENAG